jgi:hypothetical protein
VLGNSELRYARVEVEDVGQATVIDSQYDSIMFVVDTTQGSGYRHGAVPYTLWTFAVPIGMAQCMCNWV